MSILLYIPYPFALKFYDNGLYAQDQTKLNLQYKTKIHQ